VISKLITEINETFGLGLDEEPDLSRDPVPVLATGTGRMIVVGASHMRRVAAHLAAAGCSTWDLSVPGWTPGVQNIETVTNRLKKIQPSKKDTVALDLLSNSVFMGTDDLGLPTRPVRSEDGSYHIVGDLQAAPVSAIRKVVSDCNPIIDMCKDANIVFVLPYPRYVCGKCCENPAHVSNFGTDQFVSEINSVPNVARAAIGAGKCVVCPYEIMAETESVNLDDPATCWADPVHMVPAVYAELSSRLIELHSPAGSAGPSAKRARLESVQQPMPAVRGRGRPSLPAWVLGKAAPMRRGWPGGTWGRGTYGTRGSGSGPGRVTGSRGGLRGRVRGRGWGRGRY